MTEMQATRDAYGKALVDLGHRRPDVVVLDADLSESTRTAEFKKVFPERFFNAGIAEQNLMGMAAGLALAGKIPFASTFAVFASGRAWEQIRNSIAYPQLPVRVVASHAGLTVGEDGASHQALEDLALMRVIPNMTVIVPMDGPETERVVEAVVDHPGPVYVRTGRAKVPTLSGPDDGFEIGKGRELADGTDVALVACGIMVSMAMQARDLLAAKGIAARVINMPTIKPLDEEMLRQAAEECGAMVTAEEHSIIGGLGSAVTESLAQTCPIPIHRVGVQDQFGQSGPADELLTHYGLTPEAIAVAAEQVIAQKRCR